MYKLTKASFESVNGRESCNRPLYSTNSPFMVITGHRPQLCVNLGANPDERGQDFYLGNIREGGKAGNLYFGIITDEGCKWFHHFNNIVATYDPGMMRYELTNDKILNKAKIHLSVVPLVSDEGFIVKIQIKDLCKPIRLIWVYGGASGYYPNRASSQDKKILFNPDDCQGNKIKLVSDFFSLTGPKTGSKILYGLCSFKGRYKICNAELLPFRLEKGIDKLLTSKETTKPLIVHETKIKNSFFEGYINIIIKPSSTENITNVLETFKNKTLELYSQCIHHYKAIAHQVVTETPDKYLDKVVEAMCIAMNAMWCPPSFFHGSWTWMTHYLGWRTWYGADAFGWHDRVRTAILAHGKTQIKEGMYKGRVWAKLEQDEVYNMNEVYLDKIFYNYCWTGDKKFIKKVFPIIKGVLSYEKKIFDSDNDGLYESFLNTWISDNHWYGGGGCTQSSAYNYRANLMAAEIAKDIGEDPISFEKEASTIKEAMNSILWIKDKGYYAEYKDFLGYKRVHLSPELPTIYHPIEFYLTDDFQSYQMLRFTEYGLENVSGVCGKGRLVYSSDWWPAPPPYHQTHGVRELIYHENLNLALACYRIGKTQRAYEILQGSFLPAYEDKAFGRLGYEASPIPAKKGTIIPSSYDFGDTVSLFCRVLVEGLFGILPELQHNRITIMPGFPSEWKEAKIKTPDVEYKYTRKGLKEFLEVTTAKKINKIFKLIAKENIIEEVTLNGKKVNYNIIPSIGKSYIIVKGSLNRENTLSVTYQRSPTHNLDFVQIAAIGQKYVVKAKDCRLLKLNDPEHVLFNSYLDENSLEAKVTTTPGNHTFFVLTQSKDIIFWEPIDIEVRKPLEVVNQRVLVSKRSGTRYSFNLRNNLDKLCKLEISSCFLKEKNKELAKISSYKKSSTLIYKLNEPFLLTPGSNILLVKVKGDYACNLKAVIKDWKILQKLPELKNAFQSQLYLISLNNYYNGNLVDIFTHKYLSPRSKYLSSPTLSKYYPIRKNGLSVWSGDPVPNDDWMRRAVRLDGTDTYMTGIGIPFKQVSRGRNVVFISLWDNFSSSIRIPIKKKLKKIYLLITGTTNHMQSQIANGEVIVNYEDGTKETLELINPTNYDDGLSTYGYYHYTDNARQSIGPKTHADILDIVVSSNKTVDTVELKALSNEIIIGLLGMTVMLNYNL